MSFNYYENSNYVNNRNRKRTLILDVEDSDGATHLGAGGEFNIQLYEPLRIDKHSEIYLDNFLTFNSNIAGKNSMAFALKINEFNMNSNVASTHNASGNNPGGQHLFNSLIIPNEHKNPDNNHTAMVHKGKKFNYVCDINPQTISSLSGTITDIGGEPIFHGAHNTTDRFTYALTGIREFQSSGDLAGDENFRFPLMPYDKILGITAGGSNIVGDGSAPIGNILVTSYSSANTIHFSLKDGIDVDQINNGVGAIVFTIRRPPASPDGSTGRRGSSTLFPGTDGTVTIANAESGTNPNIQLIRGDGRFIAEFSIVSRE